MNLKPLILSYQRALVHPLLFLVFKGPGPIRADQVWYLRIGIFDFGGFEVWTWEFEVLGFTF